MFARAESLPQSQDAKEQLLRVHERPSGSLRMVPAHRVRHYASPPVLEGAGAVPVMDRGPTH